MKIAIAFYGIPRSTLSYPSIEQKIFSTLPKDAEVKIFYHLYDQAIISNKRSGENSIIEKAAYAPFLEHNGELELPGNCLEKWQFEQVKSFGDTWNDEYQSLSNLLHQLNSLFEVTTQIDKFGPDMVLFLRPDLIYHDSPPSTIYSYLFRNQSAVFVPSWQWWGGYNDRFAFCGKEAYSIYGKRITQVIQFCEQNKKSLNSEELVKFVLDSKKLNIYPLNVRASRARVDGTVKKEIFSSYRGMGGIKHCARLAHKKINLIFNQK